MAKYFLFLIIFNMCFMKDIFDNWSDEAKAIYYQTEKISPETALYYQLGCPLPFCNLGYAYSDNWTRGFMWDAVIVSSIYLDVYLNNIQDDCDYFDKSCFDKYEKGRIFLNVAAFAISIFKYVETYNLAEKYNDNLYNRIYKNDRPYFSLNYSTDTHSPKLALTFPLN
mgnify:CR=1 FL=1